MYKIYLLIIGILLCASTVVAQKSTEKEFKVSWNDANQYVTSRGTKVVTALTEESSFDKNGHPIFSKKWQAPSGYAIASYEIINPVYQNLDKKFLLNKNSLKSGLTSFLNINKERDDSFFIFSCIPVVKDGNAFKKLISFSVRYNLMPDSKRTSISSVDNSVLSSGEWFKFSIDRTGVFKITPEFLNNLGINTANINPRDIRIYGNGGNLLPQQNDSFRYEDLQENSIVVSGEEDGAFNDEDYILFYGVGPHGWKEDNNGNMEHVYNIYSDVSYYFITVDQGQGSRIASQQSLTDSPILTLDTYDDHYFYNNEVESLYGIGQMWVGEKFDIQTQYNFTVPFKNAVPNQNFRLTVKGVAQSFSSSSMDVSINDTSLATINYQGIVSTIIGRTNQVSTNFLSSNQDIVVGINYNKNGNPSAVGYLDYFEVEGLKNLVAEANQFGFYSKEANSTQGVVQYNITESSSIEQVWNVTDPIHPKVVNGSQVDGLFSFRDFGGQEGGGYHVLNDSDYYTPTLLSQSSVPNQNLHALSNIDYLIITQEYLLGQAERLANHHRNNGLTVEVVDLMQIYNEFGSGSPDVTAIRDFVRHVYLNADTDAQKVKYVCLFGDASYDYKDRISGNNNIVPVFLAEDSLDLASSYVTDDYYGFMDDNEGILEFPNTPLQDVATGRIPVTSIEESKQVVDKILNYYATDSFGDWRSEVIVVADDVDDLSIEIQLEVGMERIADDIKDNKPFFNVQKIYADAYPQEVTSGGERYPEVKEAISQAMNSGCLLFDYFGHGGEDGLAGERILEVEQIQGFDNYNQLPLFITITCEFSKFDNPSRPTAGEYLFWNPNGGAASLITTTREIRVSIGRNINERIIRTLLEFNDEEWAISESLMNVKNIYPTNEQRYFIYNIGDPAMRLAVPQPDVVLTSMNDAPFDPSTNDVMQALSRVKFGGVVQDESGALLSNFNGELDVTVFDKPIDRETLGNNTILSGQPYIMEFDAQESKVFTGRASVTNGVFDFEFVVPRDIRIAEGVGKISLYAENQIVDKGGFNSEVIIGGIDPNAPEDNTPPTIALFMNDESFLDGGQTNQSPNFLAILQDENGINTSITAVDHDIVGVLDGNQAVQIVMNDFYETELDDFTKGKVTYPFEDLEPGPHTIELCAWDTYNNRACATLNFVVVDDSNMVLENVLNYPNPFINHTEFWFNHNKPNENLEVQVQIFTVSGKLVKTINQNVLTEGSLSRSITWDGLDDFGKKIGKGVYVYRLSVTSTLTSKTEEKYEKLVILQ